MVEYSDVFDEVDEFQKKAKVTIEHSAAGVRTPIWVLPVRSPLIWKTFLMSFYIVRRGDSKNVYERGHDRIAARLPPP
jgi:hypothetical protein